MLLFQVSVIQSCSHGINKVVESLQEKFPSISKSQLRNKVREVSNFVDNRWQVSNLIHEFEFPMIKCPNLHAFADSCSVQGYGLCVFAYLPCCLKIISQWGISFFFSRFAGDEQEL